MINKSELLAMLVDIEHAFSINELQSIIDREFFDDVNALDSEIVDAALCRLILLKQGTLDEKILQREREKMMRQVFRRLTEMTK